MKCDPHYNFLSCLAENISDQFIFNKKKIEQL